MKQFLRYILVGVFNTAFGYLLIFMFMYGASLSPELSNVLAYTIAVLVSYFLNKSFTFSYSGGSNRALLRYIVVFLAAYAANYIALLTLIHILDIKPWKSQILAGAVYVTISFVLNKYFVFRPLSK